MDIQWIKQPLFLGVVLFPKSGMYLDSYKSVSRVWYTRVAQRKERHRSGQSVGESAFRACLWSRLAILSCFGELSPDTRIVARPTRCRRIAIVSRHFADYHTVHRGSFSNQLLRTTARPPQDGSTWLQADASCWS
jgi:hypothetical protein